MRLADSNILIYAVDPAHGFLRKLLLGSDIRASGISIPEVFGFQGLSTADEHKFKSMFELLTVLPVDDKVLYRAAELRRIKRTKLGDAIIAATALEHDCELVTRNEDDFRGIAGLRVFNPFKQT